MTKKTIFILVSIVIGTALALYFEKWFYLSLLLYVPLFLIERNFHPPISKAMRHILKKKTYTLEEMKTGIRRLGSNSNSDIMTSLIHISNMEDLQPLLLENGNHQYSFHPIESLLGFGGVEEILEVCKEICVLTDNIFKKYHLSATDQDLLRAYGERLALLTFYLWRTGRHEEISITHNHVQTQFRELLSRDNSNLLTIVGKSDFTYYSRYSDGIGRNLSRRDRQVIDESIHSKFSGEVTINLDNERTEICHAYVIHLFHHMYMLHVWISPKFKLGWHSKSVSTNKLCWIEKYS